MTTKPFSQKIVKPWGDETILSSPDSPVTSKILHLKGGARFSLQYHDTKVEVLTLISGDCFLYLGKTEETLKRLKMEMLKGYLIEKNMVHRCEAITEATIFESSTPENGKTVRLKDDYRRGDETQSTRKTRSSQKIYMG